MKTLELLIQMILGITVPLAAQRWDRRRLSAEQRERAWNGASWGAALYAFGPISMLGWCWVTRRGARVFSRASALAIALGVGSLVVVSLALTLLGYLLDLALGLPADAPWKALLA
jgi:hypothetical protein